MEPGDLIDSLSREIKRASDWDRVVYPLLSDIKYQGDFLMKDGGPLRRLKWPSLQKVLRTAYLLIRGGKWDIDALKTMSGADLTDAQIAHLEALLIRLGELDPKDATRIADLTDASGVPLWRAPEAPAPQKPPKQRQKRAKKAPVEESSPTEATPPPEPAPAMEEVAPPPPEPTPPSPQEPVSPPEVGQPTPSMPTMEGPASRYRNPEVPSGKDLLDFLTSPMKWSALHRMIREDLRFRGEPLFKQGAGPLDKLNFSTRKAAIQQALEQLRSRAWDPSLLRPAGEKLTEEQMAHLELILLRSGDLDPALARFAKEMTDASGKPLIEVTEEVAGRTADEVVGETAEQVTRGADEVSDEATERIGEEAAQAAETSAGQAYEDIRAYQTRFYDPAAFQELLKRYARAGQYAPRILLMGEVTEDELDAARRAAKEILARVRQDAGPGSKVGPSSIQSEEARKEFAKRWFSKSGKGYSRFFALAESALAFIQLNGGRWDPRAFQRAFSTVSKISDDAMEVSWRGISNKELDDLDAFLRDIQGYLGDTVFQRTSETARSARGLFEETPGAAYRPLQQETLREVLDQIAAEERLDGKFIDKALEWLAPVFGNRGEVAAILWMPGFREKTMKLLAAQSEDEAMSAAQDILRALGYHWEASAIRFPRAARILGKVLLERGKGRGSAFRAAGATARAGTGAITADRILEVVQRAARMPEIQALEREWRDATTRVMEEIQRLYPDNPHLPPPSDELTLADVLRYREVAENKEPFDALLEVIGVDASKGLSLRDAYLEKLLDTYYQKRLEELGGMKNPRFSRWLQKVGASLPIRAWREQALLTPRYHAANFLDSLIKGALFGLRPIKPTSAFTLAQKLGLDSPPPSVLWRTQRSAWDEFLSPEDESALEVLVGRLSPGIGAKLGKLVKLNRRIAQAMESSFRSAAWASETVRQLKAARPMLDGAIRSELGAAAEDVIRRLDAAEHGVLFSPEQLGELLRRVGATPDQVAVIQGTWKRAIDEASLAGEDLAKKIFFDYDDERNIEALLGIRAWAPFHFWATRNIPFYLETLSQHPWLLRAWETSMDVSQDLQEEKGLPPRFSGTLPLMKAGLLEFLFGPGTFYVNPLVILSIADQLGYRYTPEDAPLLERLQTELSRFGLGLAPWAEIPLGIVGAFGEDWAPPRVLRHSRLLYGLTGIDIEAPLQMVSAENREAVTGSAYLDAQIKRRILELSLEETGRAAHPEYVAALSDPSSPIWKRAEEQVRRRLLGQEILGMTVPVRMPFLPETEELIRAERAKLPERPPKGFMTQLARAGHPAAAYEPLRWQNTEADRLRALLQRAWNTGNLTSAMNMLRSTPEGQRYLMWLEMNGYLWPWDEFAIANYAGGLGTRER
jgi:hypothetical protein